MWKWIGLTISLGDRPSIMTLDFVYDAQLQLIQRSCSARVMLSWLEQWNVWQRFTTLICNNVINRLTYTFFNDEACFCLTGYIIIITINSLSSKYYIILKNWECGVQFLENKSLVQFFSIKCDRPPLFGSRKPPAR